MPKKGRPRKKPHQLKTVAFDEYIYDGKPGKHAGVIVCRNNKQQLKFNNHAAMSSAIQIWKALQYQLVRGVAL